MVQLFFPAAAYPNFSQNKRPKTNDFLNHVCTLILAVAWGSGVSFLCISVALGLKSAAKFGSRFQRLLVTFSGPLGVQFGAHFGHNFGARFRILV